MDNQEIRIFNEIDKLADYLAQMLDAAINNVPDGELLKVALSGGSTPREVFRYISANWADRINWAKLSIFWVDERCVPPDDDESNYKMTRLSLLQHVDIHDENIFRVLGENDAAQEAFRYSNVIAANVGSENGWPRFDFIFLGVGDDGHTASIFPGNTALFHSTDICVQATHPQNGQKRITITGGVINNAANIIFILTGRSKAHIAAELLPANDNSGLPAAMVKPVDGKLTWLLDSEAAKMLNNKDMNNYKLYTPE